MGSKHAMNFDTVSRRDDLISLTYLLIYLVQGSLNFCKNYNQDNIKLFKKIQKKKNEQTPEQLCEGNLARPFLGFVKVIHSMEFEQCPDYEQLQQMLQQISIQNCGQFADDYDWMASNASIAQIQRSENMMMVTSKKETSLNRYKHYNNNQKDLTNYAEEEKEQH